MALTEKLSMPSRGLTGWAGAPRNGASVPVAAKAEAVRNDRRDTRGSDRVIRRVYVYWARARPSSDQRALTAIQLCSHVGQAFRACQSVPICRAEALPHLSSAVTPRRRDVAPNFATPIS